MSLYVLFHNEINLNKKRLRFLLFINYDLLYKKLLMAVMILKFIKKRNSLTEFHGVERVTES